MVFNCIMVKLYTACLFMQQENEKMFDGFLEGSAENHGGWWERTGCLTQRPQRNWRKGLLRVSLAIAVQSGKPQPKDRIMARQNH
jgi:hypothetical protein